jgi:hypothetical protein
MKEIATPLADRQYARAVAIEHVRWLRAARPWLRPFNAVLPVRRFIVERPVSDWSDVIEIFARAYLHLRAARASRRRAS